VFSMNFREMRARLIGSYGKFVFFPVDPETPKVVSTRAFTHLVIGDDVVLYAHKIMEEQVEEELQENYDVVYEAPILEDEYFVSPNTRLYNLNFRFKNGLDILKKAMRKPFEDEIEIMRKLSAIVEKVFSRWVEEITIGMKEIEMANLLDSLLLRSGITGFAYKTIVTSSRRSLWLNPMASEKKVEKGEIVYVDSSSQLEGYTLNFSRVIFTAERREWLNALERINQLYRNLGNVIKPGTSCNFLDAQIRKIGDFPHYSVVPSGGFYQPYAPGDCVLEEDMVMTVVPSIYLKDGLIRVKRNILVRGENAEFLF